MPLRSVIAAVSPSRNVTVAPLPRSMTTTLRISTGTVVEMNRSSPLTW
jgi:hypothetical protein